MHAVKHPPKLHTRSSLEDPPAGYLTSPQPTHPPTHLANPGASRLSRVWIQAPATAEIPSTSAQACQYSMPRASRYQAASAAMAADHCTRGTGSRQQDALGATGQVIQIPS